MAIDVLRLTKQELSKLIRDKEAIEQLLPSKFYVGVFSIDFANIKSLLLSNINERYNLLLQSLNYDIHLQIVGLHLYNDPYIEQLKLFPSTLIELGSIKRALGKFKSRMDIT